MKRIFLIAMITFPTLMFGQRITLKGSIIDNQDSLGLVNAYVKLLQGKDSVVKYITASDIDGKYIINDITPGMYILQGSYLGYKTFSRPVELGANPNPKIDIVLQNESVILNDVSVIGKTPPIVVKGDTSEMRASSYKVHADASAEDLVKKMPGMQVENGKINAQGEEVKRVLVDGKVFFGNDPNAVLKNLPADMIEKVQVYDKSSEQSQFTGIDDGNAEKAINLITKADKREGKFGRASFGYGTEDRYKGAGIVNFFSAKQKLTLLGMSNNVNEQNFSQDDLSALPGADQGRGGRRRFRQNDMSSGILQTHALGINYFYNPAPKLEIASSLFGNMGDNLNLTNLKRHYTSQELQNQLYSENSTLKSKTKSIKFNARVQYAIDSSKVLIYTPAFNYGNNEIISSSNANTDFINIRAINNQTKANQETDNLSFSNDLNLMWKLHQNGRSIMLGGNQSYSKNQPLTLQDQITILSQIDSIDVEQTINQKIFNNTFNNSYSLRADYIEPISKKESMVVGYNYGIKFNENDRRNYNVADGIDSLNQALSNNTDNQYWYHKPSISYRYKEQKIEFNLGAAYQYAALKSESIIPTRPENKKYFSNILPSAGLRWNFKGRNSIRLDYDARTQEPSISQIQDVIDNSNALFISAGNPDLKQSYSHNLRMRFNLTNPQSLVSVFLGGFATYTNNYIGSQVVAANRDTLISRYGLLPAGAQFSTPQNFDQNFSFRTFSHLSFPFSAIKSNVMIFGFVRYSNTPSGINDQINEAKTFNYGGGYNISSNFSPYFDFTVGSRYNLSNVKNSLSKSNNGNSFTMNNNVTINYTLWKKLVLSSDVSFINNYGISSSGDPSYILWNGGIGYKFLKKNAAEVKLYAFDLLKNNQSLERTFSDIYFDDVTSNILTRYFMLMMSYKF